jgi:hypothetical protein
MKIGLTGKFLGTLVLAAIGVGCGGGGGGSSSSTGGTGTTQLNPTTKKDVGNLIAGYSQGLAGTSFRSYGPKLFTNSAAFYDSILGLYATAQLSPEGLLEKLFTTQQMTTSAGTLKYTLVEANFTTGGTISVTAGKYSGLTGTYNQTTEFDPDGTIGYEGTISYSQPNVSTGVSNVFTVTLGTSGASSGTATVAVALASGYTQTEKFTYNLDGTMVITTTDPSGLKSSFNFAADFSGKGTITGNDAGLPASVTWDANGTGTIKFANGLTEPVTDWSS